MQTVNDPKQVVFSCDYRSGRIRVSVKPSVYFDTATQALEIDQNPAGERSLVPVTHAGFSDDIRTIQLEAVYRDESESFEVTSTYDSDQVMRRLRARCREHDVHGSEWFELDFFSSHFAGDIVVVNQVTDAAPGGLEVRDC